MNNPMSRKLFQTRDAREKLRGMGGIMASSPELSQTVARFNDGGMVDEFSGLPPEMTQVTVPVVGATPRAGVRGALTPQQEAALLELGITPEIISQMSPEQVDEILNFEDITQPTRQRFADYPQPDPTLPMNPITEYVGDIIGLEAPREARVERAAAIAERDAQRAGTAAQMEAEAMTADEPRNRPVISEEPAPEDDEELTGPDAGTAALTGVEGTGAAIGRGDFDTTYDQMLSRLQNVMGTEDKGSREQAMANLAMIGLAIAAGQSPDALTNIAQGALIGMKGIQEAEAAETAREREMRLEAMRLASSEVELGRRLESAERIAAMRATGGTGTYTPERLYQQNLNAILSNPDMFDVFEGDTVSPAKATALAESLSQRGMSLGTGGGEQQYTPGQLVVQDGVTYEYQQDGTWQRAGE